MTIPGVGPQLSRAALGTDPRGVLVFESLPADLQRAEDSTAAADRARMRPRGFARPATDTERQLLEHLGHELPDELVTTVTYPSPGVRRRRWLALEGESTP